MIGQMMSDSVMKRVGDKLDQVRIERTAKHLRQMQEDH